MVETSMSCEPTWLYRKQIAASKWDTLQILIGNIFNPLLAINHPKGTNNKKKLNHHSLSNDVRMVMIYLPPWITVHKRLFRLTLLTFVDNNQREVVQAYYPLYRPSWITAHGRSFEHIALIDKMPRGDVKVEDPLNRSGIKVDPWCRPRDWTSFQKLLTPCIIPWTNLNVGGFLRHPYAFGVRPNRVDSTIDDTSPQYFSTRRRVLNVTRTFIREPSQWALQWGSSTPTHNTFYTRQTTAFLSLGGCINLRSNTKTLLASVQWPKTLNSENECRPLGCLYRSIPEHHTPTIGAHGHNADNRPAPTPTGLTNYVVIVTMIHVSSTTTTYTRWRPPNQSSIGNSGPYMTYWIANKRGTLLLDRRVQHVAILRLNPTWIKDSIGIFDGWLLEGPTMINRPTPG